MDLFGRFPGVVGLWVSLPFDQVLQFLVASVAPVTLDHLHLVFFFGSD
jgi:hypothetical protein